MTDDRGLAAVPPTPLGWFGTAAVVLLAAVLGVGAVGSWLEGAMLSRDDGHVVGLLILGVLALAPVAAGVIMTRRTRQRGPTLVCALRRCGCGRCLPGLAHLRGIDGHVRSGVLSFLGRDL